MPSHFAPYRLSKSGAYYFTSGKVMRDWRKAHPNCTCYYDEYDWHMDPKSDCPDHGEATPVEKVEVNEATAYRPPPEHYRGDDGIDPWRYIEAHGLDYWAGNVIKYVTRAGRKEIATVEEDLMKARDFLNYMIERERKESS